MHPAIPALIVLQAIIILALVHAARKNAARVAETAAVLLPQDPAAAPPPPARDLVLFFWSSPGWHGLKLLLASLREHMPGPDVTMITDPRTVADRDVGALLRRFNVSWLPYDAKAACEASPALCRSDAAFVINVGRHHAALLALENDTAHRDVFVHDARDVFFQGDIFAAARAVAPRHDLVVFGESLLLSNHFNRPWAEACGAQPPLMSKHALCAGTVFGTRAAMVAYQRAMVEGAKGCEPTRWSDQGLHNVLVYHERLGKLGVAIRENDQGPVGTIGGSDFIKLDAMGRVVDAGGRPYAVVHQFDRWRPVEEMLALRYPFPVKAEVGLTAESKASSWAAIKARFRLE